MNDGESEFRAVVPEKESDWALVEQVRRGNDRTFDELMGRYKKPILNFVYRMLGNVSEAEDVAQLVFVRVYQNITKSDFQTGSGRFSTWLFQVAHNAAIDSIRKQQRSQTESINGNENRTAEPTTGRTADKDLTEKELGRLIADAVSKLPPDQKTAIILSEYHDMSYAEIAGIMKCSEKSVESRLYRAKQTLRKELAGIRD